MPRAALVARALTRRRRSRRKKNSGPATFAQVAVQLGASERRPDERRLERIEAPERDARIRSGRAAALGGLVARRADVDRAAVKESRRRVESASGAEPSARQVAHDVILFVQPCVWLCARSKQQRRRRDKKTAVDGGRTRAVETTAGRANRRRSSIDRSNRRFLVSTKKRRRKNAIDTRKQTTELERKLASSGGKLSPPPPPPPPVDRSLSFVASDATSPVAPVRSRHIGSSSSLSSRIFSLSLSFCCVF